MNTEGSQMYKEKKVVSGLRIQVTEELDRIRFCGRE